MPDLGFIQKGRRYVVIAIVAGSVAAMLFHIQWEERVRYVEAISVAAGVIFILCGQRLRLAAARDITGRKYRSLVMSGTYLQMRHPLYAGNFLAGIGVALVVQSVTIMSLILILYMPLYWMVIRAEEKQLFKVYGEPYALYCSRVPPFFPRHPLAALGPVSAPGFRSEIPNMIGLALGVVVFFTLERINEYFELPRLFL